MQQRSSIPRRTMGDPAGGGTSTPEAAASTQPVRADGLWGWWLRLSTQRMLRSPQTPREREHVRRSQLLSTLHLTAIVLTLILTPRGFLPVFDLGTVLGLVVFSVILAVSVVLNRWGRVTAASGVYVGGLIVAIAGSQLATPSGKIGFEDLAGYDLLVIPLLIAGVLLPSRVSVWLWAGCASFVVLDLGLAQHGANLDAYLPTGQSQFTRIYPVAIYPIILMAVVAVVAWLAARSVARALDDADRTAELERAYALLADQKRALEDAIGGIQQVHAQVANGDLSARAPTVRGDPLLPLAVSLNLTLDRLARTTLTATLTEDLQNEAAILSQFLDALRQARLNEPTPIRQMRYLRALASNLEQLRLGMLQAIRQSRTLVERIDVGNSAIERQVRALATLAPADAATVGQLSADVEQVHTEIAHLHHYLSRFL